MSLRSESRDTSAAFVLVPLPALSQYDPVVTVVPAGQISPQRGEDAQAWRQHHGQGAPAHGQDCWRGAGQGFVDWQKERNHE
jgi:hypothetical protein